MPIWKEGLSNSSYYCDKVTYPNQYAEGKYPYTYSVRISGSTNSRSDTGFCIGYGLSDNIQTELYSCTFDVFIK